MAGTLNQGCKLVRGEKGDKLNHTCEQYATHTHTHTHTHTQYIGYHRTPLSDNHQRKTRNIPLSQYIYLVNGTTNNLTSESAKCKIFYLATKAALNLFFGLLDLHQQLHCLLPLLSHVPQFQKKIVSGWVVKFGYLNSLNANVGKGKLSHSTFDTQWQVKLQILHTAKNAFLTFLVFFPAQISNNS